MRQGRRCREEVVIVKQRLTADMPGSDDLAVIAAFEGWRAAQVAPGGTQAFCEKNYLDGVVMKSLMDLRNLILEDLIKELRLSTWGNRRPSRMEADEFLRLFSSAAGDRVIAKAIVV